MTMAKKKTDSVKSVDCKVVKVIKKKKKRQSGEQKKTIDALINRASIFFSFY